MDSSTIKQYAAIGVASGSALFIFVVLFFGFGGNETLIPIEFHFAVQGDLTESVAARIWSPTPIPTITDTDVFNASLVKNGVLETELHLLEVLPTENETNYASATGRVYLTFSTESELPILDMTMAMSPIVWRKDINPGKFLTFLMWLTTLISNNWKVFTGGLIVVGIGQIALGVSLLLLDKMKAKQSAVTQIPVLVKMK